MGRKGAGRCVCAHLGDGARVGPRLGQDLILGTRQRGEDAGDVLVRQVQPLLHLGVAQLGGVVEQQQRRRLQRRKHQLHGPRVKVAAHVARAQRVHPLQLAVLRLRVVKRPEGVDAWGAAAGGGGWG